MLCSPVCTILYFFLIVSQPWDISALEEILRTILEIVNAALTAMLVHNPHLIYALLHRQRILAPYSTLPQFSDIMSNIDMVSKGLQWSVALFLVSFYSCPCGFPVRSPTFACGMLVSLSLTVRGLPSAHFMSWVLLQFVVCMDVHTGFTCWYVCHVYAVVRLVEFAGSDLLCESIGRQ